MFYVVHMCADDHAVVAVDQSLGNSREKIHSKTSYFKIDCLPTYFFFFFFLYVEKPSSIIFFFLSIYNFKFNSCIILTRTAVKFHLLPRRPIRTSSRGYAKKYNYRKMYRSQLCFGSMRYVRRRTATSCSYRIYI